MIKQFLKKVIGKSNIYYLKSLVPTKQEKEAFKRRKAFYAQFLEPGDLYFDIGANLGNRIAPALSLEAKVVAVEPQEECCTFLKRKYGTRIQIVPKGVGEKEDKKEIYQSESHMISSFSTEWIASVKNSGRFADRTWNKGKTIRMTTLDQLIKLYGLPAFIKIDVEGYELEVLKGLSQSVPVISFEYAMPEQREQSIKCIERLQQLKESISCNYSLSESMEWAGKEWFSGDQMIDAIKRETIKGFGDIYVKMN